MASWEPSEAPFIGGSSDVDGGGARFLLGSVPKLWGAVMHDGGGGAAVHRQKLAGSGGTRLKGKAEYPGCP